MQMMAPDDWRTPTFRQNMISKIEEAIQQCGATMNAGDLENQLFSKARHKEEYMGLVTRIIMHIKEKGSKKHGVGPGGGVMSQQNTGQPGPGGGGGPMQQPQNSMGMMQQMNPMTSMNQMGQVGVMNQQGMVHLQQPQMVQQLQQQQQQQQQQGGGMGGNLLQQQQQSHQQQIPQQQQQQQNQMMNQSPITLGLNQMQHLQQSQLGGNQMQMSNVQMQQMQMQGTNTHLMSGGGPQVMLQSNQTPQGMMSGGQTQMMMGQQQQNMMASQGGMSQQQQQGMMGQQQPQQGGMIPGGQQSQPGQPQQMMQVRGLQNPQMVGNRMMTPQPNVSTTLTALAHAQQQRKAQQQRPMVPNAMGIPRPEHGPNYSTAMNRVYYGSNSMTQVDNVPVQFSGVPQGSPMQQKPNGPFIQNNAAQGMSSPSPGGMAGQMQQPQQPGFVNSPGSQGMMHRPSGPGVSVSGLSPYPNQMVNVPSPSTNLNTPMTMAATPSPRNPEDVACIEKIKELRKYTDLLQRMIAKIGNEDMEKSSKMKRLLEILTNPNPRVTMEILLKCEVALKRLERHDTGGGVLVTSTSVPTPQPKDQTSPFQLVQDAVLASMKNGASSHTFLRTFRQSIEALAGQQFATSPDASSEDSSESQYDNELTVELPGVLRRELKIIDNRFKVKVIKNPKSLLSIIVHVDLLEPQLPRVPPLKIHVPPGYPDDSPKLMDLKQQYKSSEFLTSVAKNLKARIFHLSHRFTVSELLRCWEMSVRQVSNPHYKTTVAPRRALSKGMAKCFFGKALSSQLS